MNKKLKIIKTKIKGPYIINTTSFKDKRGQFTRLYCFNELQSLGLKKIAQINLSQNLKKHTFRGLHYQTGKYAEDKIVICTSGKIQDFFVNIDKKSKDYLKGSSVVLDSKKKNLILVPKGFAHGFLTLTEKAEVIYFSSNFYSPKHEKGIRWNDPKLKLRFTIKPKLISEKDKFIDLIKEVK